MGTWMCCSGREHMDAIGIPVCVTPPKEQAITTSLPGHVSMGAPAAVDSLLLLSPMIMAAMMAIAAQTQMPPMTVNECVLVTVYCVTVWV
mmetsp:Transcript_47142/g.119334  ORF Transcript_47142/g.119334 Transcript_47142/m.119334 type:complete len:90 (+) Transcript_47142:113-382(+)